MIRTPTLARTAGALAAVTALGCADPPEGPPAAAETAAPAPSAAALAPAVAPEPALPAVRPQIDGRGFPDKVLALTWDDGPDAHTLELAQYLHRLHVSATFFVVDDWVDGVSSDPGEGTSVFDTGAARLPILGDLVDLGHRLGNHTLNHVILSDADAATVVAQLRGNQARIDPWITNDLRLFRAPGGAWNAAASRAVDADPEARRLVGPIRWDVDGKDWEKSLYCRSSRPALECEPAAPGHHSRVKVAVVAHRYLEAIQEAGHGIVLFHDRVGHVGSRYALEIAHLVIPELTARGYVFAAPVLRFSPLAPHALDLTALPAGDHADVDGDGKPDRCTLARGGVVCAVTHGARGAGPTTWSAGADFAAFDHVAFGDLNGDGRADVCGWGREGVVCALSTGHAFTHVTPWMGQEALDAAGVDPATIRLVDVGGDGRVDLCGRGAQGTVCAMAP